MLKKQVVELLINNKLTIGSIESLTGGLFASTISEVPGVSKVFKGSIVSYATEIKRDVVLVDNKVIDECGVVSKECAKEMALKGQKLLKTDIAISFTGNAGPDVMENKEVGLVYVGLLIKDELEVYELKLQGTRNQIREECVKIGFEKIISKLR